MRIKMKDTFHSATVLPTKAVDQDNQFCDVKNRNQFSHFNRVAPLLVLKGFVAILFSLFVILKSLFWLKSKVLVANTTNCNSAAKEEKRFQALRTHFKTVFQFKKNSMKFCSRKTSRIFCR
uniref:Transmembrane protein n=1 Tax=Aplanochytrium stocchinoi TaxID=215587 RepID=A0A7S3V0W2_9STRA